MFTIAFNGSTKANNNGTLFLNGTVIAVADEELSGFIGELVQISARPDNDKTLKWVKACQGKIVDAVATMIPKVGTDAQGNPVNLSSIVDLTVTKTYTDADSLAMRMTLAKVQNLRGLQSRKAMAPRTQTAAVVAEGAEVAEPAPF